MHMTFDCIILYFFFQNHSSRKEIIRNLELFCSLSKIELLEKNHFVFVASLRNLNILLLLILLVVT